MATSTTATETACRRCPVRCDTVVYVSGCIAGGCPALYANERDGRSYVGCLHGVFAVEIDLDVFERLQTTRPGFGALRAVRPPQPMCETEIDSAFAHRAQGICINPGYLLSASRDPLRVIAGDVDHR